LRRYDLDRVQQERDRGTMEFEETKRQLEEDADREIEELKVRRCTLTVTKPVLKAPMVAALETRI
jgi:hypothetical protein